jgi:hypothetical protein
MKTLPRSESSEQTALMTWAMFSAKHLHGIDLLHAIPNGGHRHALVARKMKQEGVRAGVPDLCLPVARQGFHGLYIEMKATGRKTKTGMGGVDPKQKQWIERLRSEGYRVEVCYGAEEAIAVITDYLKS